MAVKVALEEWRHWLEGAKHPLLIWTDHRKLTYIREAKRLNSRQARWALFFNRFDFVLSYHPGSKNVTGLPESQGNTVILVVVDRFSKACHLLPLPKLPTASQTGELLMQHVFRIHGFPQDIVSDRVSQFTCRFWKIGRAHV